MVVLRTEAERGQIREDFLEPFAIVDGEEARDVFEEEVGRIQFLENASKVRPDPAVVVEANTLACHGGRLARKAGDDEVKLMTPGSRVKGEKIRPHR